MTQDFCTLLYNMWLFKFSELHKKCTLYCICHVCDAFIQYMCVINLIWGASAKRPNSFVTLSQICIRLFESFETHKCTHSQTLSAVGIQQRHVCISPQTNALDDVIFIICWNLGQLWQRGSRRDEQSLS